MDTISSYADHNGHYLAQETFLKLRCAMNYVTSIPLLIVFVILLFFIFWFRSPKRRWKIDANVREIVNSKPGTVLEFPNLPMDLVQEYIHQLKGYKGVRVVYQDGVMFLIKE